MVIRESKTTREREREEKKDEERNIETVTFENMEYMYILKKTKTRMLGQT